MNTEMISPFVSLGPSFKFCYISMASSKEESLNRFLGLVLASSVVFMGFGTRFCSAFTASTNLSPIVAHRDHLIQGSPVEFFFKRLKNLMYNGYRGSPVELFFVNGFYNQKSFQGKEG